MSSIVIFGSARENGETRKVVDSVFQGQEFRFVDLKTLNISPFDYQQQNQNDDFLPLMEELVQYTNIVLASPVYWYSVSSHMKIFMDRWSDLLTSRKDLAKKIEGKKLFLIGCFGTDFPLGCMSFESPIRHSCNYLNIHYGGAYYHSPQSQHVDSLNLITREQFRSKIFEENHDLSLKIKGRKVQLRLAIMSDREVLYQWKYHSDTSHNMSGPPLYPEKPIKTWEEFKASWSPFYYQMPHTSRGHVLMIEFQSETIGAIAYHRPDSKNRSKIDIWLRSEKDCGKGLGSDALNALCCYLYREFGILFFWLQPSARNPRAIHVYQKIGFKKLPLSSEEAKTEFGHQDYHDSVYLLRDMSL